MQNVDMKVEGTKLHITVDLSVNGEPSKSGKSIIVATTEGNADVPGQKGMKIGLNIYKPLSPR